MIYPTEESRAGLSDREFERRIATATGSIWATMGRFCHQVFQAAHLVQAPRHGRGR